MNKNIFVNVFKFVVKYVVPVILGYLEGDMHVVESLVF